MNKDFETRLAALNGVSREEEEMSARVFNFKSKTYKSLEKLTINRGQQEMLLQYVETCMLASDSPKDVERFANIHNMIYGFCQEEQR